MRLIWNAITKFRVLRGIKYSINTNKILNNIPQTSIDK